MSDSISRLRELSEFIGTSSRNVGEWTIPVNPSDLRYLLKRYDELLENEAKRLRLLSSDDYVDNFKNFDDDQIDLFNRH